MKMILGRLATPALVFLVPLPFAAASAHAAAGGYLYVAGIDTTPTTQAFVSLPINAQSVGIEEHSLFEMSMSDQAGASGNSIEIGVTTDSPLNGDWNPHWFVSSWINGTWQGYDGYSGFVSFAGAFWNTPLTTYEGTSQSAAFQFNSGNWWLYLNGAAAGYFPGSEWSGAFAASSFTDVFGEVYCDGTFYPTLNGSVSGYASSGGGHLSTLRVDSPYSQSGVSETGFTASGPVPEPSTLVLFAACGVGLGLRRRRKTPLTASVEGVENRTDQKRTQRRREESLPLRNATWTK